MVFLACNYSRGDRDRRYWGYWPDSGWTETYLKIRWKTAAAPASALHMQRYTQTDKLDCTAYSLAPTFPFP